MAWTHEGHAIELVGERFSATVEGKVIRSDSLTACKKQISKLLAAKAAEVPIRLQLTAGREGIGTPVVVVGLDSDTLTPKYEGEPPSGWHPCFYTVAPDEYARLYAAQEAAYHAYRATMKALESVQVSLSFDTSGRYRVSYPQAIQELVERYEAAKQANGGQS